MLTSIHILLTYKCNLECDHCFLFSGPRAEGTFTLPQIRHVLSEAAAIGTVDRIYFEGGEPFLFYPSMLEGIRLARSIGFQVGVVTNAYGAVSDEDALLWLRPLAELGVADLSISDDSFHYGEEEESPAKRALAAARQLSARSIHRLMRVARTIADLDGRAEVSDQDILAAGGLRDPAGPIHDQLAA